MSDWVKFIVGLFGGLFSGIAIGVLVEPLKHWAGMKYMTCRAEKAIYWELSALYALFCMDDKQRGGRYIYVGPEFKSERFDYYYAEHREALFGIPTWNGIKKIYDTFHSTKQQVDTHELSDAEGADRLSREFTMCLELGMIDKKKLFRK